MDFDGIISAVRKHHPQVEGIYIFGTFGTPVERPDSDLDLALLLSLEGARKEKALALCIVSIPHSKGFWESPEPQTSP
jgi:predicted nucleotidyltransferase